MANRTKRPQLRAGLPPARRAEIAERIDYRTPRNIAAPRQSNAAHAANDNSKPRRPRTPDLERWGEAGWIAQRPLAAGRRFVELLEILEGCNVPAASIEPRISRSEPHRYEDFLHARIEPKEKAIREVCDIRMHIGNSNFEALIAILTRGATPFEVFRRRLFVGGEPVKDLHHVSQNRRKKLVSDAKMIFECILDCVADVIRT
jgi:hypothetical protein